jgi:DNA adenine methylase
MTGGIWKTMSIKFYETLKRVSSLGRIGALKSIYRKRHDIRERLLNRLRRSRLVQKFVSHMTNITPVDPSPIKTDTPADKTVLLHAALSKKEGPTAAARDRLPKPFVKWAGGKGQLLPELVSRMPDFNGTYFEPFVGGGALFFFLRPKKAVIQDSNEELIHCFKIVREQTDGLIEELSKLKYSEEDYYRIRDLDPDALEPVYRAARTIYLNRTGFNGLYRVNKSGKFNVPMGRYTNPMICDEKNLRACALALKHTNILAEPFETVLSRAKSGDFVYFDPPYVPVSKTANFTAYQGGGFSTNDQERLASTFITLTDKGVYAMLSNADVPWTREAYKAFRIHSVQAKRRVNSNAAARGPVGELIVTNY